jgi:hypothetical protein
VSIPSTIPPAHKTPPRVRRIVGIAAALSLLVVLTAAIYCQTQKVSVMVVEVSEIKSNEVVTLRLTRTPNFPSRDEEQTEEFVFEKPGRYEIRTKAGDFEASVRRYPKQAIRPCLGVFTRFRLLPLHSKVLDLSDLLRLIGQ